jgi:protein TonB
VDDRRTSASRLSTGESSKASSSPSAAPEENKTTVSEEAPAPIVIKNNHSRPAAKSPAGTEAPDLSIANLAPAVGGGMPPDLMASKSDAPTPVLQRLNVSQGVSRGLLVKQVQPKYPTAALQLRMEGTVELAATISKDGNVSAVKVLSGDPQLSKAAADAVKQWKYKPYLLNGSPFEIQTQITVNFKLPK